MLRRKTVLYINPVATVENIRANPGQTTTLHYIKGRNIAAVVTCKRARFRPSKTDSLTATQLETLHGFGATAKLFKKHPF